MVDLRRGLKTAAEVMLSGSGMAALSRRRQAVNTLILAYHNIVPDGETASGDLSLHLPQRSFARQLDVLVRTHDVIPLSEVLAKRGPSNRPRAVITFDDATQGALTAGAAELRLRGLPATVFIAPAFVGGRSFWWDSLTLPGRGGPDEELRQHALTVLGGSDARIREWAVTHSFPMCEVPAHQTCATEAQLHAAATDGLEFGSHTWSHPNLTALAEADLQDELARPLAWLSERFGNTVPWLAYPYGLWNPVVGATALAAGYRGALRVDGGWLRARGGAVPVHAVPRQNIPSGLSTRGFELRVSGVTSG